MKVTYVLVALLLVPPLATQATTHVRTNKSSNRAHGTQPTLASRLQGYRIEGREIAAPPSSFACMNNQGHNNVTSPCGSIRALIGPFGRSFSRRMAKSSHGADQKCPAIARIDSKETRSDPVILDKIEAGGPMRRPGREIGVKQDVDAVVDIRAAERSCAKLLSNAAVASGSKCEELNVSKSSQLCLRELPSMRRAASSLIGHSQK